MKPELTVEERRSIGKIRANRIALTVILWILIFAFIADALFLASEFSESGVGSDVPEWIIIPFAFGVASFGFILGLIFHLNGKLKDKERGNTSAI
ncbi:MAG TPA: hypothetical protein ENN67_01785 [Firmicutes bacterium]|nr:hypothetical protein [Bacillota bacterium]